MLERAKSADVPVDERWNIGAVWRIESARIEEFIDAQANTAYGRNPGQPEGAKKLAPDVWARISNAFPHDDRVDADILDAAKTGQLQTQAGSRGMIVLVTFFLALMMGAELAIFFAMWMLGNAHPLVILQGGLLAGGSWALGWGICGLMLSLDRTDPEHRSWLPGVACALGVLAIALITALRVQLSGSDTFAVIAVTVTLALLIALLEAVRGWISHRYGRRRNDMFRAQVQFANGQHNSYHQMKGEGWMDQFRFAVDRRARRTPEILGGDNAS
jgi:hypothetical protein